MVACWLGRSRKTTQDQCPHIAARTYSYGLQSGIRYGDPSAVEIELRPAALAFQPLGPVHLKAVRETGGVRFSWRTRKRGLAGVTFAARIDLGETSEAYELEILSGSTVLRTLSATSASTLYAASDETLDFGSAQSSFGVRLYQISAAVGRGLAATATLIP